MIDIYVNNVVRWLNKAFFRNSNMNYNLIYIPSDSTKRIGGRREESRWYRLCLEYRKYFIFPGTN